MLHPTVQWSVDRYLAHVDRLLPGRVTGFYVIGSTALGAYLDGRSDIDFVAIVDPDGDVDAGARRRLRLQHACSACDTGTRAISRLRSPLAGTCNGMFVRREDLRETASAIVPVASHIGPQFHAGGTRSEVTPVDWKVFAEHGIAVRGDEPRRRRPGVANRTALRCPATRGPGSPPRSSSR